MSAFSVVVVTHDSAADLRALVASFARWLPEPPPLIVVDSGSRDDSVAVARAAGAEVVVLDGNPGFGAANNVGVARARHDVTVLLNPDVELVDAAALPGLAALARDRDALHVPRLLNADGSVQRGAHPLPGTAGALLPAVVHPRVLPRAVRERVEPWRAAAPRTVGWAIAAAVAARTSTLRALGPFDPDAFLFYEDLDLCLHARAAGVPTVPHPGLALRHHGATSTGPAFGGEPFDLLARRRREVIGARLGHRALALDDAAQALTFATRAVAHRDGARERAQFAALRRARGRGRGGPGAEP